MAEPSETRSEATLTADPDSDCKLWTPDRESAPFTEIQTDEDQNVGEIEGPSSQSHAPPPVSYYRQV